PPFSSLIPFSPTFSSLIPFFPPITSDLLHSSAWVQGLALSTLGSLGSAAMLRDLAGEVEQLAKMGQLSVRRKVQILRLLRILGQDNEDTSEAMNDTLAQVATNTETTRNVGNAILYETVLTIMGVQSTSGLRVLAVNILGRFLLNKDRNISLALVNNSNVRTSVKELLAFLNTCAPDLKSDCASGIFLAAEKFAPNKRWHIDTILQVLTMAGSYVRDDSVPNLICLIGGAKELHSYAVQQLYSALAQDISQVNPEEMLSLLERVLQSHLSLPATRAYALTALMKLGTHLQGNEVNRIRSLVSIYCSCHDTELQQRAVEYNALFRKYDHLRASVLEKMPIADKSGYNEEESEKEQNGRGDVTPGILEEAPSTNPSQQEKSDQVSDLLDLLGGPVDASLDQTSTVTPSASSFLDFLGDLSPTAAALPRMTVYEQDGLLIEFSMERPVLEPTLLLITATVSNQTPDDIPSFTLQVAVPKVELLPPSSSVVPSQGRPPVTQVIRVLNPKKLPLRMRLRLAYTLPSGAVVQQIEEINSFPETAWK
ncbi:hypothetical protein JD844_000981, partial [Phrynosoma platyrhinos]